MIYVIVGRIPHSVAFDMHKVVFKSIPCDICLGHVVCLFYHVVCFFLNHRKLNSKLNVCGAWGHNPLVVSPTAPHMTFGHDQFVAFLGTQIMEYGPTHHTII